MIIDFLSRNPEHIETAARWIYDEFIAGTPRTASYERVLENLKGSGDTRLPLTYLALIGGECVGTVSVVMNDLKTQETLSPWLAAVVVRPDYRGRGIAEALIRRACADAKRLGYGILYLRTEYAGGYYKRLGWEHVCDTDDEYGIRTSVYRYQLDLAGEFMKGICYIVAAGAVEDLALEPSADDFVIAADAGYLHLPKLSVVADLVVGDFDSLKHKPNHPNVLEFPCEKDETDVMIAVREGLRRDYRKFLILGGLGGRLDHTLANIQTLSFLASHNACGYLVGGGTAVTVIRNGSIRFDSEKKGTVSVFCCGETASGVYLRGLKYPLTDAVLTSIQPLGVSNEFTGADSEISVKDGTLAVMWEDTADCVIDNLNETCYSAV
jgi:thiamine pyrophosphokinase